MPPVDVSDDGEEKLDWGSNDDDYNVEMALAESAGISQHKNSWYNDTSYGDPMVLLHTTASLRKYHFSQ